MRRITLVGRGGRRLTVERDYWHALLDVGRLEGWDPGPAPSALARSMADPSFGQWVGEKDAEALAGALEKAQKKPQYLPRVFQAGAGAGLFRQAIALLRDGGFTMAAS